MDSQFDTGYFSDGLVQPPTNGQFEATNHILGGSSQVSQVVRITPIYNPWKGRLEGVPQQKELGGDLQKKHGYEPRIQVMGWSSKFVNDLITITPLQVGGGFKDFFIFNPENWGRLFTHFDFCIFFTWGWWKTTNSSLGRLVHFWRMQIPSRRFRAPTLG